MVKWEGALPLSNLSKICLQKGFILYIILRVSFWSSIRGVGAFTLSGIDVSIGRMVSVGLHVLLWVWVAGLSGVDITNMVIEAVGVVEVSLTPTNHDRQSATLLKATDITSMWCYRLQFPETIFYFVVSIFTIVVIVDKNVRTL